MLRVYTASKLGAAQVWHDIQATWPEIYCHARWLKHNKLGTPDSPEMAKSFWIEDEEDVRSADVLVVLGRQGEHLRGALVEAGIAIASGIPVIVVGEHSDYGTWQYHPGVRRVVNLDDLHRVLIEMNEAKFKCR